MLRRQLLRLLATAPLLRPGRGPLARQTTVEDARNAADVYRRAFPWSEAFPSSEWAAVREAAEASPIPPQADRWLEAARPALATLREAAEIDACRWGDEAITAEGISSDRFDGAHQNLVRLACLSAIRHAEAGRFEAALDDAFAALVYERRIGEDGPLIARLFQCAGEIVTRKALGRILPLFDRPALASLANRLDAQPPPRPASAMIGPELRFMGNCLRPILATVGESLTEDDWQKLQLVEEAPALKRLTGGDPARLPAYFDATSPAFAELGRLLGLPHGRRDAALDDFIATRRETDPIAATFVEACRSAATAVERAKLMAIMLRAGLVLVSDGEAAFRDLRDPYAAGPFGLERLEGGWTIRSGFPDVKEPTTAFRVGTPG